MNAGQRNDRRAAGRNDRRAKPVGSNPGRVALTVLLTLLVHPFTAFAQGTFPDWVNTYFENRAMQLESVDQYVRVTDAPGPDLGLPGSAAGVCARKICQGFDVAHGTLGDGTKTVAERPKPPEEMGVEAGITSSALLQAMGQGLFEAQLQINGALGGPTDRGEMAQVLNSGAVPAQVLVTDPRTMFAAGGQMMTEASVAVAEAEKSSANSDRLAREDLRQQLNAYSNTEFTGREQFGDTLASVYSGNIPPELAAQMGAQPQSGPNAPQFLPGGMKLWVDDENQRFLKQRLEGKAVVKGQTRDFYIEIEYSDFRNPPGCGQMDEPFKRTMRMGGILDDEQMAQMEEARAKLAEFDQQLAAMPAQQRQMMERMMGSQMQQMRNMIESGAFEYVEQTEQIICNPDLASLYRVGTAAPDAGQGNLVQRIQEYLVILGFEPGNIDGVLDVMTQIAISEFQAMQGLPVTGEPSEELAGILAMLVEGQ